jgi:glycosyltransferase involved in cell wall biosynthesis
VNILLSSDGFLPDSFGGGQVYVYRLAKELLRRGHVVNIVTPIRWRGGESLYVMDHYIYKDVPVITFAVNPINSSWKEGNSDYGPITLNALRAILQQLSPDLVHINGIKAPLVHLCNEQKIPHAVTAHHTGIVCPAGGLILADGSVCDRDINHQTCVPCCNYWRRPKWYTGGLIGRIPSWIYRPMGERLSKSRHLNYFERGLITPWLVEKAMAEKKTTLRNAQLFIAPSNFMRDLLVSNGGSPAKVIVVPHGIEPIGKMPLPIASSNTVRFGYIGRIDPSKGLHILLEASEFLPESSLYEMHIFGAPLHSWHEEYLKKTLSLYKGKTNVCNHGFVPHDKIQDAFASIDVLVVPSLLPEAFGLVVAEAFSAGRPVIVFNSGALPELITNGMNGFIIQEKESKFLADAMQKLIDRPSLIIEMAQQVPHVKTMDDHVNELDKIYLRLLTEKPA